MNIFIYIIYRELSKFEKLLKSIKYTKYMNILHEKYQNYMQCLKNTELPAEYTCHRRCKEEEALYYKNIRNENHEYPKLQTTKIPCTSSKIQINIHYNNIFSYPKTHLYCRTETRFQPLSSPI